MIDRTAPTRRPSGPARGFQQWRSLLFIHWEVAEETLRHLVPRSLDLDLLDGKAYVGVVPFAMEGVRPAWCPRFAAFRFLETNVRTYVIHRGRPGVYFFSLDAASRIAVWAARKFWGLPYFDATMEMRVEEEEVFYETRRPDGPHHRVRYRWGEPLGSSREGTAEFFFLERYLLFVERQNQILAGQVHHSPYPAHQAEILEVNDSLMDAAGLAKLSETPCFVHYSPGVDVEIFDLRAE